MSKLTFIILFLYIYSLYCQETKLEGIPFTSGIESSQGLELLFPTKITKIVLFSFKF